MELRIGSTSEDPGDHWPYAEECRRRSLRHLIYWERRKGFFG
jgi:hypothetical protein